jgi:hypothetical protein
MKNEDIEELIDKAMAGRLSAEEQVRWAALVAERPELDENLALGEALRNLPQPPVVSSNFTTLVLQQINRHEPVAREHHWLAWLRWRGFARVTGGAAIIAVAFVAMQARQNQRQIEKTARTFAGVVSAVAAKPDIQPEAIVSVMKDFDAIRQLPDTASVDYGLLAALRSN